MAPEVCEAPHTYGPKCDIWSIGVLTYVLLSGLFPFKGENEIEIEKKIKSGEFDFDNPCWNIVSDKAK